MNELRRFLEELRRVLPLLIMISALGWTWYEKKGGGKVNEEEFLRSFPPKEGTPSVVQFITEGWEHKILFSRTVSNEKEVFVSLLMKGKLSTEEWAQLENSQLCVLGKEGLIIAQYPMSEIGFMKFFKKNKKFLNNGGVFHIGCSFPSSTLKEEVRQFCIKRKQST